jgi:hypothetical protein
MGRPPDNSMSKQANKFMLSLTSSYFHDVEQIMSECWDGIASGQLKRNQSETKIRPPR